jgi:hypothetical protein
MSRSKLFLVVRHAGQVRIESSVNRKPIHLPGSGLGGSGRPRLGEFWLRSSWRQQRKHSRYSK